MPEETLPEIEIPAAPAPTLKNRFSDAWDIPNPKGDSVYELSVLTGSSWHGSLRRSSVLSVMTRYSDSSNFHEEFPCSFSMTPSRRCLADRRLSAGQRGSYEYRSPDRRSSMGRRMSIDVSLSTFSFEQQTADSPRRSSRTDPYLSSFFSGVTTDESIRTSHTPSLAFQKGHKARQEPPGGKNRAPGRASYRRGIWRRTRSVGSIDIACLAMVYARSYPSDDIAFCRRYPTQCDHDIGSMQSKVTANVASVLPCGSLPASSR